MQFNQYAICSNPSCNFSVQAEKSMVAGCPWCGSDLIFECPHCHNHLFFKNQSFCVEKKCRKPIKPVTEAAQEKKSRPRKKGSKPQT